MPSKITNCEKQDTVLGAKAIGAILGETPRHTFNMAQRNAFPCWKQGGRYAASRAELARFMADADASPPSSVVRRRELEKSKVYAKTTIESLVKKHIEELGQRYAEEDRRREELKSYKLSSEKDDHYKASTEEKDYSLPTSLLAKDFARLLADESFPRELWERRHRAEALQTKFENQLL